MRLIIEPDNKKEELGYNKGFTFGKNVKYYFTFYARREQDFEKPIKVSFRSEDGNIYSQKEILITDKWQVGTWQPRTILTILRLYRLLSLLLI